MKFGFPMAFSVTMLSWGLVDYKDAYEDAGELSYMLDSIKWPLDYFMKAHIKQDEFYGQVGVLLGFFLPAKKNSENRDLVNYRLKIDKGK